MAERRMTPVQVKEGVRSDPRSRLLDCLIKFLTQAPDKIGKNRTFLLLALSLCIAGIIWGTRPELVAIVGSTTLMIAGVLIAKGRLPE